MLFSFQGANGSGTVFEIVSDRHGDFARVRWDNGEIGTYCNGFGSKFALKLINSEAGVSPSQTEAGPSNQYHQTRPSRTARNVFSQSAVLDSQSPIEPAIRVRNDLDSRNVTRAGNAPRMSGLDVSITPLHQNDSGFASSPGKLSVTALFWEEKLRIDKAPCQYGRLSLPLRFFVSLTDCG